MDDINRCSEDRIITIIDALRVMLEDDEISKKVIVVSAIDERVLKRAINLKYHDLLNKDLQIDKNELKRHSKIIANEYMDKLFLSGVHLGVLTLGERKEILSRYIDNRVIKKPIPESSEPVPEDINDITKPTNIPTQKPDEKPTESDIIAPEVINIDGSKYDLAEQEEVFLMNLMSFNKDLTPRQIRIFYYRYLLARNILVSKLKKSSFGKDLLEKLGKLLMHYTLNNDLATLKSNKISFVDSDKETVSFEMLGTSESFNKGEIILLHEVLETVVAY